MRSPLAIPSIAAQIKHYFCIRSTSNKFLPPFHKDNKEWKIEQRQHTPLELLQLELARERRVLYSEAHQERVVAGMRQGSADVGVAGTIADEHIMQNCP